MSDILAQLAQHKLIPVVKIEDAAQAVPLAEALMAAGLPVAEITFRTAAAGQAIRNITTALPDMLVGAGTVLRTEQARLALDAGARFIVSPGFNPRVVDFCLEQKAPVTPGISSPSDLDMALERDLNVVKFFPAEALGGLPLLKAMAEPYHMMRFIPTGGISAKNLCTYLAYPKVIACGGSWMVKADLISSGQFSTITQLTAEAVNLIRSMA